MWIIRIMLWLFSFNRIEIIVKGFSKVKPVSSTSLRQILLARYGYSSLVKIGVSRSKGEFEAHAWLEHGDEVVLGESERDFVPIMNVGE